ncbi:MAG TPA: hypothetical protein VK698_22825 [Kofleriaceae bacterium]|nr:hypothetical protein [Kofleriaceae bacterium]
MPDLLLSPFDRQLVPRAALGAILGGAAALIFGLGLVAGRSFSVGEPGPAERCALPAGIDLGQLGATQRDQLVERTVLCAERERGHITPAEHRARLAALARLASAPAPAAVVPEVVWASRVRSVSSQYGEDSWSGGQMLGPPDATPAGQDSTQAWASAEADSGVETVEVGFDGAHRMSSVDIVENVSPGAIKRVELILAGGGTALVEQRAAAATEATSAHHRVAFACTEQPVISVRVTLDSAAVPGWNEIDAIGGQPCGG